MANETVKEILERPWNGGTRVINCIVHSGSLTERPEDCKNCATDLKNQFNYALRVNDFLNQKVDDALAALRV